MYLDVEEIQKEGAKKTCPTVTFTFKSKGKVPGSGTTGFTTVTLGTS